MHCLVTWLLIALVLGAVWDASIVPYLRRRSVRELRKLVGWQFAGAGVGILLIAPWFIPEILGSAVRGSSLLPKVSIIAILFAMASMYWIAWWALRNETPSARVWGVGASLASLLGSLRLISHSWRLARWCTWFMAALSIASLVLFLWPNEGQGNEEAEPN
jgi:O-antigen/teichoic acid export membrane protein